MIRQLAAALLAGGILLAAPHARATPEIWYVVPAVEGECGDECYVPPTAWIEEPSGRYSLGVTCGGDMILGGPASRVSEPPVPEIEMEVDGRTLGRFRLQNGLNDIMVQPADGGPNGPALMALLGGTEIRMLMLDPQPLVFTLNGSRAAMSLVETLCRQ